MARGQRCSLFSCPVGAFIYLFLLYRCAFAASPQFCWLVWLERRPHYAVWAGISRAWASTRPRLRNVFPMCVPFYYG